MDLEMDDNLPNQGARNSGLLGKILSFSLAAGILVGGTAWGINKAYEGNKRTQETLVNQAMIVGPNNWYEQRLDSVPQYAREEFSEDFDLQNQYWLRIREQAQQRLDGREKKETDITYRISE